MPAIKPIKIADSNATAIEAGDVIATLIHSGLQLKA